MDVATLAEWATVLTGLVAVFGLVAIPIQLRASRAIQIETSARQMYQAFLEKAVEYSALLNEDDQGVKKISEKLWNGEPTDKELQFDWFMYYATECFESILVAFGHEQKFWRDRIRIFVAQYAEYIDSSYFKKRVSSQFLPETRDIVTEAVRNRANILEGML